MWFGSFVAGATCIGSGAIAFPVMTLVLRIQADVARDMSMMIQSCGMSSATFLIIWSKMTLDWESIIFCTIGSSFGLIIGLEFLADLVSDTMKKMFFAGIWSAFAIALFIVDRRRTQKTYECIQNFCAWKAILLVVVGFVGGIITAISGSGVDICCFTILTLFFTVSERIATPSSVVMMAANSLLVFYWRRFMMNGISVMAWNYLAVSVPFSVVSGPLGSFVSSHFHRQTQAWLVYILEIISLASWYIIEWPNWRLAVANIAVIVVGVGLFVGFSFLGNWVRSKEVQRNFLVENMKEVAAYENAAGPAIIKVEE